jgi:hypothetical protein
MGEVLGAAKMVAAAADLWPRKNGGKVSSASSGSSSRMSRRMRAAVADWQTTNRCGLADS